MGLHGDLAPLGLEHLALDAHDVADVGLLELGEGLLPQLIHADIQLDAALHVLEVAEHGLTHPPLAHNAARHGGGLALQGVKALLNIGGAVGHHILGNLKGVLPGGLERRQLLPADSSLLAQVLLRLLGCLLFTHGFLLLYRSIFSTV